MADSPPAADTADGAGMEPGSAAPAGTPRWVKVSGIVALIVVGLLVVMILAGGGQHGPDRHAPSGGQQQPGGHTPPAGGH